MEEYLQETKYIDYTHPLIQNKLEELDLDGLNDVEKAKKIFYFVRDSIEYSVKDISLKPSTFKASQTLQRDFSFCIPKALLLVALARAVDIPARIHLVDFYNHRLSKGLEELWGTKVMAGHCYSELYLNDRWIKATPSLDIKTCNRHEFKPVEFDGKTHGLLHERDQNGKPHAEYINDHGTFSDLPLSLILKIFEKNYGPLTEERVSEVFGSEVEEFQLPNPS